MMGILILYWCHPLEPTKSNIPLWMFFIFFKSYKWCQIRSASQMIYIIYFLLLIEMVIYEPKYCGFYFAVVSWKVVST